MSLNPIGFGNSVDVNCPSVDNLSKSDNDIEKFVSEMAELSFENIATPSSYSIEHLNTYCSTQDLFSMLLQIEQSLLSITKVVKQAPSFSDKQQGTIERCVMSLHNTKRALITVLKIRDEL